MGQAKLRGSFEERKAQAITEGRVKETAKENSPLHQLERMAKHPEMLLVGPATGQTNLIQLLLDVANRERGLYAIDMCPPGLRTVR